MKNYSEQIKVAAVDSTAFAPATANTVLSGDTDVKIEKSKVVDTSGNSSGAFSGLSAGDVIYMTGWDQPENNGIFTVVGTEDDYKKLILDYPLLDEAEPSSGGVTMHDTPQEETVSGVEAGTCVVTGVTNIENPLAVYDANLFKVTDDNEVSHFAETDGDNILIIWADLSLG